MGRELRLDAFLLIFCCSLHLPSRREPFSLASSSSEANGVEAAGEEPGIDHSQELVISLFQKLCF